jgi:hypothetical protein
VPKEDYSERLLENDCTRKCKNRGSVLESTRVYLFTKKLPCKNPRCVGARSFIFPGCQNLFVYCGICVSSRFEYAVARPERQDRIQVRHRD